MTLRSQTWKQNHRLAGFCLALILSCATWTAEAANPGTVNQEFGNNGNTTLGNGSLIFTTDLAVTASGTVYVGYQYGDLPDSGGVIKLGADGNVDTTFGTGGGFELSDAGLAGVIWALAPSEDGGVFFTGGYDTLIVGKLSSTGTVEYVAEKHFDLTIPEGSHLEAHRMTMKPGGGEIVVAAELVSPNPNALVTTPLRKVILFRASFDDGSPETYQETILAAEQMQYAIDLDVARDGAAFVLLSHYSYDDTGAQTANYQTVTKVKPDGGLDAAFASNGVKVIDSEVRLDAVDYRPLEGPYVVGLQFLNAYFPYFAQFSENGDLLREALPPVGASPSNQHGLADALIYEDGSALIFGYRPETNDDDRFDFHFEMMEPDGFLHGSFGMNGQLTINYESDLAWRISRGTSGLAIAAGESYDASYSASEIQVLSIHTIEPDLIPDAMDSSESGVEPNAEVTFISQVTGMSDGAIVPILIENGEYRVGSSAAWVSAPGYIRTGDTLSVRHSSASTSGGQAETTVIIGGYLHEDGTTWSGSPRAMKFTSIAGSGKDSGGAGMFGFAISFVLLFVTVLRNRRRPGRLCKG